VSSRLLLPFALVALVLAVVPSGAAAPAQSWAQAEIRVVVSHGLLAEDVASFRPDDDLTRSDLSELIAAVRGSVPSTAVPSTAVPSQEPVTVAALHASLVRALGLADASATFVRGARAAGVDVPARFGNEIVARMLGLRPNHPASRDQLELLPGDLVSRAEAAYSVARILRFRGAEVESVRAAATTFVLPSLTGWQRSVLATAFSRVGYPYVWAGEGDLPAGPAGRFGPQAQGGFDCSGFVWRVYKLQSYPGGETLGTTLRGRTTYELSGELPRPARVPFAQLRPGDVVFFGAKGPRSKPAQVDHAGIYVAPGWFVHSSRDGVTLTPLVGWYRDRFARARRPLTEAAIEP
jgi:cell wall-associated NlpC family hydrolase